MLDGHMKRPCTICLRLARVRPAAHKLRHGARLSTGRGGIKCRRATEGLRVNVCISAQEQRDDRRMAMLGRRDQRRDTEGALGLQVGALS
eukprot:scaffold11_cov257-Pinguiococcus_pyrenoidosus.AAC.38